MSSSATEDILLWNRFRYGDDLALVQLMQSHFPALYQYSCSFCQLPDLVDDTIQESFFDLLNERAKRPLVSYGKTYLLSAPRNRLIDTLRRLNRLLLQDG